MVLEQEAKQTTRKKRREEEEETTTRWREKMSHAFLFFWREEREQLSILGKEAAMVVVQRVKAFVRKVRSAFNELTPHQIGMAIAVGVAGGLFPVPGQVFSLLAS